MSFTKLKPDSELPLGAKPGVAPVKGTHATALQLATAFPFAQIDEAKLYRLSDAKKHTSINPRTGTPWIPKPVKRQWPINETIVGLWEWTAHELEKNSKARRGFYDLTTMEASEGAGVFTKKFLQMLKNSGCAGFHDSGRIEWDKLLPGIEAWLSGDNAQDKNELQREGTASWSALREKYLAKSAKLEFEELDARLVDAELAQQTGLTAQAIFFAMLDRLGVDFPGRLAGRTAAEIKTEVGKSIEVIRTAVKKEFETRRRTAEKELQKSQREFEPAK